MGKVRFGTENLTAVEIEAILSRFEEAAARDGLSPGIVGKHICAVCRSLFRVEINRGLLAGVLYRELEDQYKIDKHQLHRHYYNHLLPLMKRELEKYLLDLMSQFVVVKRLLFDETNSSKATLLKYGTFDKYLQTVINISDTMTLIDLPRKSLIPGSKPEESETIDDYLTAEQRKVLAEARWRRRATEKKVKLPDLQHEDCQGRD